jgi:MFS transporter, ACS family, glucarate transporter
MNSLGQVGGMVSPYLLGWLLEKYGSWTIPLLISAAYYAISAALWFLIDPEDSTFAPTTIPAASEPSIV